MYTTPPTTTIAISSQYPPSTETSSHSQLSLEQIPFYTETSLHPQLVFEPIPIYLPWQPVTPYWLPTASNNTNVQNHPFLQNTNHLRKYIFFHINFQNYFKNNTQQSFIVQQQRQPYGRQDRRPYRRPRTIYTDEQRVIFETFFTEKSHYPNLQERMELKRETGVDTARIATWFQNRRASENRRTLQID